MRGARPESQAGREASANATERPSLAAVREELRDRPSPLRDEILAATLTASGEVGYAQLTVADVVERYGGYRLQFYQHFASLGECYSEAHATHLRMLEERLLGAATGAAGWRAGLRAALVELGRFAEEEPLLARGLLVEAHVAGGPAIAARRQEVLERLSRAVDSARRETSRSRHSPPPLTATFMVSAIEAAVVRGLMKRETEGLVRALVELEFLVASAYF